MRKEVKVMADRKKLIEKIAKKGNLPKPGAGIYLSILMEVIRLILARSGELKLPGFGTLKASGKLRRQSNLLLSIPWFPVSLQQEAVECNRQSG